MQVPNYYQIRNNNRHKINPYDNTDTIVARLEKELLPLTLIVIT